MKKNDRRTIEVSAKLYAALEKEAALNKTTIEVVIAKKMEVRTYNQFDKQTKDGVLRRVYYYQKKRYGDVPSLKKFIKKWKKDKNFIERWEEYKAYDYNKGWMPTFFRHGSDTKEDALYVATRGTISATKDLIDMGLY
jgi:hypothetical protein